MGNLNDEELLAELVDMYGSDVGIFLLISRYGKDKSVIAKLLRHHKTTRKMRRILWGHLSSEDKQDKTILQHIPFNILKSLYFTVETDVDVKRVMLTVLRNGNEWNGLLRGAMKKDYPELAETAPIAWLEELSLYPAEETVL